MPFHGSRLHAVAFEAGRHVFRAEALGIEPVFERGHRPVVFERAAIPDALERWNLVVTGAAPGTERQTRVCTDLNIMTSYFFLWSSGTVKPEAGVNLLLV